MGGVIRPVADVVFLAEGENVVSLIRGIPIREIFCTPENAHFPSIIS